MGPATGFHEDLDWPDRLRLLRFTAQPMIGSVARVLGLRRAASY